MVNSTQKRGGVHSSWGRGKKEEVKTQLQVVKEKANNDLELAIPVPMEKLIGGDECRLEGNNSNLQFKF